MQTGDKTRAPFLAALAAPQASSPVHEASTEHSFSRLNIGNRHLPSFCAPFPSLWRICINAEDVEDVEDETEASEEPVEESVSEPEAEDSAQENAFDFADAAGGDSAAPASIRSSRRPRQKSENPITTMIKVGLGGLMAAPLAQLILWWAFSKDPVKLGPKVSPYVPWVVPKSLRGSGSSQVPTNTDRDDWQRLVRKESTWSQDGWRVAKFDISSASDELPGSTL